MLGALALLRCALLPVARSDLSAAVPMDRPSSCLLVSVNCVARLLSFAGSSSACERRQLGDPKFRLCLGALA